ncbi:TonB-dependent receptor [uncultured Caulobacter sp.]|uniref:TonB-dependent receptor domain-containing protein n=1 Tax=uncultured Caulobacter sp. TaxID=158749 RepID=UPI00262B8697|nr:TonB-dependent receptor [uncultured Caulobacter sp.]
MGLAVAPAVARAEAQTSFAIPAGPLRQAATLFAVQARVSIDVSAAQGCGPSRGFSGRGSPEVVLRALLQGTGCDLRRIDDRAYQIVRRAPPPAKPPVTLSPPREVEAPIAPLSELVVVATRRPTLADRLAYSVSVLDERAAAAQGVRDTNDLAAVLPAMTVTNLGPGRDKVILRGLSDGPLTGQTQSMVGIYLDDVRLTYNAPDPDLLMLDIAQVEVLRGPQGALYGAGSLGGVLQFTTHRPDPSAFAAWTSISASSLRGGEPGGQLSGMVNVPLLDGRAAVRLVAYADQQGGYIDDPLQGRDDVNRTRRSGIRAAFRVQLGEGWTGDVGVTTQAIASSDTQYATPSVGPFARRNRLAEPHDNDFFEGHVGVSGLIGAVKAKVTLATVSHDISSRYDASAAPPLSVPPGAAVAFDDNNHVGAVIVDASLSSDDHARIQWQVGGFLARTRQRRDGDLLAISQSNALLATEHRRDILEEAALFGEAIGDLGRGWSVTLGGRLFSIRSQASSKAESLGATAAFRDSQDYVGFSPKAVLSFQPTSKTLVYVQATEGYRAGGFNTSPIPSQPFLTTGGEPQRAYDGDDLWSFESGAKASLMDGRLRLRGAVFLALWKSIQSDQLLPSGLPYTANLGDGRNIGVEAEAAYVAGPLRLDASFLLNAPELEKVDPAFPGRKDLGLAGVPKHALALGVSYERPLVGGWRLGTDARLSYVGPSRLSFDATTAPIMGDYVTARAGVRVQSERLSAGLAVDNLFDGHGDTFAYGNPFSLRLGRQSTPQRPRTVSLELKVRY